MTTGTIIVKGIVHGKTIELEHATGIPEGQAVSVMLRPALPRGEGLKRAFGAWKDDSQGLDSFLQKVAAAREEGRQEPPQ